MSPIGVGIVRNVCPPEPGLAWWVLTLPSANHAEPMMQSGTDFLRDEVAQAAAIHASLLESMIYHASEADDSRYRDLCDRHLPRMREHQLMLEELRGDLGA